MKKLKTLKDIEKCLFHLYPEMEAYSYACRQIAKEWVKYLEEQEKMHWKYISNSIGEHPYLEKPKGFDFKYSIDEYPAMIRIIKKIFNIKE